MDRRFFEFLDPKAPYFTVSFLDIDSKGVIPGLGVFVGDVISIASALDKLEPESATLHVTLNQTSHRGRKKKDIENVRVLCLDLDVVTEPAAIKKIRDGFRPHLIVESSPKKYHVYWKISDSVSLEAWSKYQLAIAWHFGGDLNLRDITKTIRVPGVRRRCKGGEWFTPEIRYVAPRIRELGELELGKLFPFIESAASEASRALERERGKVARVVAGKDVPVLSDLSSRNRALFDAIRMYVCQHREAVSFEEALGFGWEVNSKFEKSGTPDPLEEDEVRKTVESGWNIGTNMREEREARVREEERRVMGALGTMEIEGALEVSDEVAPVVADVGMNGHHAVVNIFQYDYSRGALGVNRFTDDAVVQRVEQQFKQKFMRLGAGLYAFDSIGHVWVFQEKGGGIETFSMITRCCQECVLDPSFEVELCLDGEGRVSNAKRKAAQQKFFSTKLKRDVAAQLVKSPNLPRGTTETFDAKPGMVLLRNGLFDMETLTLRAPRAEDYMLKRTDVEWDPKAECPAFLEFIHAVFSQNEEPLEMVRFIQEVMGYTLSGSISEQKVFVHVGDGANGKSKVLGVLKKLVGGYGNIFNADDVGAKSKGKAQEALARLAVELDGYRCATFDDIEISMVWNEALVKTLTAKAIKKRFLYQEKQEFMNRAKVHLATNQVPAPETENDGTIRRICIIKYCNKFNHSVETSEAIDAMIEREASGILRWAVEGYQRWKHQKGIRYPAETELAMREYKQEFFKNRALVEEMWGVPLNEGAGDKAPVLSLLELREYVAGGSIVWAPVSLLLEDYNARASEYEAAGIGSTMLFSKLLRDALIGVKAAQKYGDKSNKKERCFLVQFKYTVVDSEISSSL